MTETQEIKTSSINLLMTGQEGSSQALLVGIKTGFQDKPQYQRALRREFTENKELNHPNILRYIEKKEMGSYGECIIMEWEPARSLKAYMAENHSLEEQRDIVRQIAAALSYLHGNGKVHGALSPDSIFITSQGDRVKLLNFRLRYADRMQEPADSLRYRAPEAKDGTVTLDARSDIFSLGMIVRSMGVGEESSQAVQGACNYGRNLRFASIDEFLEAFDHHRISRRSSNTATSGSNASAPGNSKRTALVIATIVALAIVAALVYFNHNSKAPEENVPATEQTDSTTQQAPEATPSDQGQAATDQGPADGQQTQPTTDMPQAQPSADTQYTGELAFLSKLVPQMHIDLDKIYASSTDKMVVKRKVTTYYKGLRGTLKGLNENQFAAFDKAFAEYNSTKKAE